MAKSSSSRFLRESALTWRAVLFSVFAMLCTGGYLVWRYPMLPFLLPVHFARSGRPNGWQFRTIARVMLPVFMQMGIFLTGAAISVLLLSRKDASTADSQPDARAAVTASEAVLLISTVWVVFQAYTAYALTELWLHGGHSLGLGYTISEIIGVFLTAIVGVRAQARLARPEPLPYIEEHWRLGQLYCNRAHPALFVPTRNGRRWTLNFGRPAAVILLAGILSIGIVAPTTMLALALR